jgi:hypothetical protein
LEAGSWQALTAKGAKNFFNHKGHEVTRRRLNFQIPGERLGNPISHAVFRRENAAGMVKLKDQTYAIENTVFEPPFV